MLVITGLKKHIHHPPHGLGAARERPSHHVRCRTNDGHACFVSSRMAACLQRRTEKKRKKKKMSLALPLPPMAHSLFLASSIRLIVAHPWLRLLPCRSFDIGNTVSAPSAEITVEKMTSILCQLFDTCGASSLRRSSTHCHLKLRALPLQLCVSLLSRHTEKLYVRPGHLHWNIWTWQSMRNMLLLITSLRQRFSIAQTIYKLDRKRNIICITIRNMVNVFILYNTIDCYYLFHCCVCWAAGTD